MITNKEKFFLVATTLYVVVVILSNLAGGKLVAAPFFDGLIPSSLFLYPLTFFLGDLVTEICGGKRARLMILVALTMAVLMHFFALLLIAIPIPPGGESYQLSLETLFKFNGLSLTASLIAFVISQLLDVKIFLWIRERTGERKLWLRTNVSTIISQSVDSFLINSILFYGFMGWDKLEVFTLFLSAITLKIAFSIFLTPFFYAAVFASKRLIRDASPSFSRFSI